MPLASWTKSKCIYLGFLTAVIRYFSPFPSQRIFMCRSSPPRLKPIAKFPNQDQRICFHIFFLKWFFGPWYFIKITKMWKLYALSEFLNHILTKFPNQDQRICFLIFLLKCFFWYKSILKQPRLSDFPPYLFSWKFIFMYRSILKQQRLPDLFHVFCPKMMFLGSRWICEHWILICEQIFQ